MGINLRSGLTVPFVSFQIFNTKSDMLIHCQQIHKQDPKPYKCPTCSKCFANSSYLSQHARIHSGIKPYKCEICERKFTQVSSFYSSLFDLSTGYRQVGWLLISVMVVVVGVVVLVGLVLVAVF